MFVEADATVASRRTERAGSQLMDSLLAAAAAESRDYSSLQDNEEEDGEEEDDEEKEEAVDTPSLTAGFIQLLKQAPNGVLEFRNTAERLGVSKQRVQDLCSVLESCQLLKRTSINQVQWCAPFDVLRLPESPLVVAAAKPSPAPASVPLLGASQLFDEAALDGEIKRVRLDIAAALQRQDQHGCAVVDCSAFVRGDKNGHTFLLQTDLEADTVVEKSPAWLFVKSSRPINMYALSNNAQKLQLLGDVKETEQEDVPQAPLRASASMLFSAVGGADVSEDVKRPSSMDALLMASSTAAANQDDHATMPGRKEEDSDEEEEDASSLDSREAASSSPPRDEE